MPHHITQRGNRRMNVFVDGEDRRVFLRMLRENSELYSLHHYSYCLMTNHLHLISSPEQVISLSNTMRDVLGSYASYFNQRYGLSGRLWQGRFYSTVLDETRFWAALRYVERNPIRAGMVQAAEAYEWSSAVAHWGLREDGLLVPLPPLPGFIGDWRRWIGEKEDPRYLKKIRNNTKTGYPCGSSEFVKKLEVILGMKLRQRKTRDMNLYEGDDEFLLPFVGKDNCAGADGGPKGGRVGRPRFAVIDFMTMLRRKYETVRLNLQG
jgi:putative transposase